MKIKIVFTLILTLLLFISCSENKVKLPIATSLGNLVEIEQKDMVQTNKKQITSNSKEELYLLIFEGKSEVLYDGKSKEDGPWRVLIDSKGTQFWPVFAGTPQKDGIISNAEWLMHGTSEDLVVVEGKLIFKGTATLPEPRVALIYLVSKEAIGLTLKDGNQRYPIE